MATSMNQITFILPRDTNLQDDASNSGNNGFMTHRSNAKLSEILHERLSSTTSVNRISDSEYTFKQYNTISKNPFGHI